MNKRGVTFITLAIAAAVVLYTILKPLENKSIKVDDAKKIVFGISLEPGSGLAILAYKKGFFKDVGLNIEVKTYPTGKVTLIEGLLSGNADIVTRTDAGIRSAADLSGSDIYSKNYIRFYMARA